MKTLLTIVVKDLRRLWPVAAGLLVITAVKFGLGWWWALRGAAALDDWQHSPQVVAGLTGLEALFTWMVTGLLVLEDPLKGSTAAWRTRPISGARLLAAKVMGGTLLLVAPALIFGAPWWWYHGLGWTQLGPALLTSVGLQVLVIVPAATVAVWVDSVARFVLWSLAMVAALIVAVPLFVPLLLSAGSFKQLPDLAQLGILLAYSALGLAMVALVVWRYRCGLKLRLLVPLTLAAMAAVVATGVSVARTYWSNPQAAWVEAHPERAAETSLGWRRATIFEVKRSEQPYAIVYNFFEVIGLKDEWMLEEWGGTSAWTWPDGMTIRQRSWNYSSGRLPAKMLGLSPGERDAETEAWLRQKRAERAQSLSPSALVYQDAVRRNSPVELSMGVSVTNSVAARLRREPSDFTLEGRFRVLAPRAVFDLPLTAGVGAAGASCRVNVTRVEPVGDDQSVSLVESRAVWDELWSGNGRRAFSLTRAASLHFVDRERGSVVPMRGDSSASVMIAGVVLQARRAVVNAPRVVRQGRWTVLDRAWAGRTTLTLVSWDEVARISRQTRARFAIDATRP